MLAANEAVAQFLSKKKAPILYRIHEPADPERLEQLMPIFKLLRVPLKVDEKGRIDQFALQHALESVQDRPGGHIIRRFVLRSLKRAEYNPENRGHFGLASDCYCHFTSPIRRYPDVVVHRQLRAVERNEPMPYPNDDEGMEVLYDLGAHTSEKERQAADAERDSENIKAIEYIERFVGDEFDGFISGVQSFGLFVELSPHDIEGLVPVRAMKDDHYDMDQHGLALIGRRSGRAFRLTDRVKVQLIRAEPFEGEVDLEIVQGGSMYKSPSRQARQQRHRRGGGGPSNKKFYEKFTKKKKKKGRK